MANKELKSIKFEGLDDTYIISADSGSSGAWGRITGDIVQQIDLKNILDAKLNKAQGVVHAGKILIVGDDGNITTISIEDLKVLITNSQ